MKITSEEALLHIVLYSKSKYGDDPDYSKLKVLVEQYSLIGRDYVDDNHLMQVAILCYQKFVPKERQKDLMEFMLDLFSRRFSPLPRSPQVTCRDVVDFCMSEIRWLSIKDLPPLPEPDETLFKNEKCVDEVITK